VSCRKLHDPTTGPSFYAENAATIDIYVNMLELIALLQIDDIEQEEHKILFLQDSVPPHFSHEILIALDDRFPNWEDERHGPHAIKTSHC